VGTGQVTAPGLNAGPEPGTIALISAGLAGLAGIAVMRKRAGSSFKKMASSVILFGASCSAASAASIRFTWDPSKSTPPLSGPGSTSTADTINAANYLYSVNQASGSFIESFILPITKFELNAQLVRATGLNSSYGLYFTITGTGQTISGQTTFNNLDIAL
jgi:hypothetical protein